MLCADLLSVCEVCRGAGRRGGEGVCRGWNKRRFWRERKKNPGDAQRPFAALALARSLSLVDAECKKKRAKHIEAGATLAEALALILPPAPLAQSRPEKTLAAPERLEVDIAERQRQKTTVGDAFFRSEKKSPRLIAFGFPLCCSSPPLL